MEKLKYCKRFMLWTAVITSAILAFICAFFAVPTEEKLIEDIVKWVVTSIGVVCIVEVFAYILAPLFWHIKYDMKNDKPDVGMD